MKLMLKITLGIILAFILMAGGCAALVGSAMDDSSTPEDKAAEIIEEATTSEEPADEPAAEEEPAEEEPAEDTGPEMTTAQANAVRKADDYLSMSGFSRPGLIDQLTFEGYSKADAEFAVDAIKPNWNKQAARKAEDYVSMSGFSRSGLVDQLKFEGFTQSQAEHGADAVGL